MPRYDIVFLDADNTLFDFDAAEHAALRLVLEERGYPATPETEALYLGFNRDLWSAFDRGEVTQEFLLVERFRLLTRALGGTDDPAAFNRDYLSHMAACSRLLPGAEALCRDLVRGGCRLALATNGVARVQHTRLAASPLSPWLEWVYISEELGAQKPQRAFFDRAFAGMGVRDKSRAVMGTASSPTSKAALPPGSTPSGTIPAVCPPRRTRFPPIPPPTTATSAA